MAIGAGAAAIPGYLPPSWAGAGEAAAARNRRDGANGVRHIGGGLWEKVRGMVRSARIADPIGRIDNRPAPGRAGPAPGLWPGERRTRRISMKGFMGRAGPPSARIGSNSTRGRIEEVP